MVDYLLYAWLRNFYYSSKVTIKISPQLDYWNRCYNLFYLITEKNISKSKAKKMYLEYTILYVRVYAHVESNKIWISIYDF